MTSMNSIDIMIDLETTGIRAGCGILSIGACSFDQSEEFYGKILYPSNANYHLKDNLDTLVWWNKQSLAAKDEAFSGIKDLLIVLGEFSDWLRSVENRKGQAFVWGMGADFDLPILAAAYDAVGIAVPWKPFNGRCYRTLKNLPENKGILPLPFLGVKHNALADAKFQAAHAMDILRCKRTVGKEIEKS